MKTSLNSTSFESYSDFLNRLNNSLEKTDNRISSTNHNNYRSSSNSNTARNPDLLAIKNSWYQKPSTINNSFNDANNSVIIGHLNNNLSILSTPANHDKRQLASILPNTSSNNLAQNYRGNKIVEKSQEEALRTKLRTAINSLRSSKTSAASNDVFYDKVSDQKFFNRNFRVKPSILPGNSNANSFDNSSVTQSSSNNNDMTVSFSTQRVINETPIVQNPSHQYCNNQSNNNNSRNLNEMNSNQQQSQHQQHQSSAYNNVQTKLKLLKKRNALKKTLSNLTKTITSSLNASNPNLSSFNSKNNGSKKPLHFESSSREDLKSLINLSVARPLSVHYSRNSLNKACESNFHKSNENLGEYKDDVVNESEAITDLKLNKNNNFNNNLFNGLNRVRSTPHINIVSDVNNVKNYAVVNVTPNEYKQNLKTKSENELNKYNDTFTNYTTFTLAKPIGPIYMYNKTKVNNSYKKADNSSRTPNNENSASPISFNKFNPSRATSRLENSFLNTLNVNNAQLNSNRNSKTSRLSPSRVIYQINNHNNNNVNNNIEKNSTVTNRNFVSSTNFNYNMNNQNATNQDKNTFYQNIETDLLVSRMNAHMARIAVKEKNTNEFKFTMPGCTNEPEKPSIKYDQVFDTNIELEFFEPSPYNIMSDPIISEQFRKLYEEDEYFRQIHRKCVEWLVKYVFPEMEREREKAGKSSS